MPVAAAAAVAAAKTGRRVRYSLSRNDDMRINGGDFASTSVLTPSFGASTQALLSAGHCRAAWIRQNILTADNLVQAAARHWWNMMWE